MSEHSVVEAQSRLSVLIDRALNGQSVVITRHGKAVVELKPISPPANPIGPASADWLAARRVGRRKPREDSARAVRRIRDAWER